MVRKIFNKNMAITSLSVLLFGCVDKAEEPGIGSSTTDVSEVNAVASTSYTDAGAIESSDLGAPNIVLILADDMGYGDIRAYNSESKVPTPNLDKLAEEGVHFTDTHTPSSVCTPTRYSLLTGRYAWRTKLKRGVLYGRSPMLIDVERDTIASVFKDNGYDTAAIGKWHIGIGEGETDYAGRIGPGPNAVGFDYYYGIPASLDMEPYVYVENEALATPLEGRTIDASAHRRSGGPGFWREGEIGEGFSHQEVLPVLTEKTVEYIEAQEGSDKPFFLYFPLPAPHTPWLPDEEFVGTSGAGAYGDFAAHVDAVVGDVVDALERSGMTENTIVIYTSDNGAHWSESQEEEFDHLANGVLRGQKADIFEAGHRVPLIAKWPGRIPAGSSSQISNVLTDLFPTLLSMADIRRPEGVAIDGEDLSPVMLDPENDKFSREMPLIHHSLSGLFAIRVGDWKLIEGLGSGGFTQPREREPEEGEVPYQLYNLAEDISEENNLAAEKPEMVELLLAELNKIRALEETSSSLDY